MTLDPPLLTTCAEGLVEIDGSSFYVIPDLEEMDPFLMSLVSDSDHWCFISSAGALTAGRRDAETALFPYETDDRLHLATGITGPVTVLRVSAGSGIAVWEPYSRHPAAGVRRAVAKSTFGDVVLFEEVNENLGLAMRFRWATSDRFGLVRQTSLVNIGTAMQRVRLADGIVNVLPAGLAPDQYRTMSNLTNAYRRSEIVGGPGNVALHTVEALMIDQAIPAESLTRFGHVVDGSQAQCGHRGSNCDHGVAQRRRRGTGRPHDGPTRSPPVDGGCRARARNVDGLVPRGRRRPGPCRSDRARASTWSRRRTSSATSKHRSNTVPPSWCASSQPPMPCRAPATSAPPLTTSPMCSST